MATGSKYDKVQRPLHSSKATADQVPTVRGSLLPPEEEAVVPLPHHAHLHSPVHNPSFAAIEAVLPVITGKLAEEDDGDSFPSLDELPVVQGSLTPSELPAHSSTEPTFYPAVQHYSGSFGHLSASSLPEALSDDELPLLSLPDDEEDEDELHVVTGSLVMDVASPQPPTSHDAWPQPSHTMLQAPSLEDLIAHDIAEDSVTYTGSGDFTSYTELPEPARPQPSLRASVSGTFVSRASAQALPPTAARDEDPGMFDSLDNFALPQADRDMPSSMSLSSLTNWPQAPSSSDLPMALVSQPSHNALPMSGSYSTFQSQHSSAQNAAVAWEAFSFSQLEMPSTSLDPSESIQNPQRSLLLALCASLFRDKSHSLAQRLQQRTEELFLEHLQYLLSQQEKVDITCCPQGRFSINDEKIALPQKYTGLLQRTRQDFQQCGLRGLRFWSVPSHEELRHFVQLYQRAPSQEAELFTLLRTQVWQQAMLWLELLPEELPPAHSDDVLDNHIFTKQTYFAALDVVQHAYRLAQSSKPMDWRSLKRTVHNVLDLFQHPELAQERDQLFLYRQIANGTGYRFRHPVNMMLLAIGFGHHLGMARLHLRDLGVASLLADTGMSQLSKDIQERGQLTPEQSAEIAKHPVKAVPLLLRRTQLDSSVQRAVHIAFSHHISTVGGGYPSYGRGVQSLASQIVAIVDRYDALTTPRPYRPKALTPPEALRTLIKMADSDFTPLLVRKFLGWLGPYPAGTIVRLSSGEVGVVTLGEQGQQATTNQPLVKLLSVQDAMPPQGSFVDLAQVDSLGQPLRTIVEVLDTYDPRIQLALLEEAQA